MDKKDYKHQITLESTYIIENFFSKLKDNKTSLIDLRHLKTYTIDDEDTKEYDDAISIEKINNEFYVWIHIASTAEFIDINSSIEKHSLSKGATLYSNYGTEYMLPYRLIENVFALKSNTERITLSSIIRINTRGEIISYDIKRALVKINYNLTYEDANEILDIQPKEESELVNIFKILRLSRNYRMRNNAIDYSETIGKLKKQNNSVKHYFIERSNSRELVSEAMILFNSLLAEFCFKNSITIPYRNQQSHINNNHTKKISCSNESWCKHLENFMMKQQLTRSTIEVTSKGHKGLGVDYYVQATSPIRRYIDYLTHCQVLRYIKGENQLPETIINLKIERYISSNTTITQIIRAEQEALKREWFDNSKIKSWKGIFLKYINFRKNIAIIYFNDLKIDFLCIINTKYLLDIGDELTLYYDIERTIFNQMITFSIT